MLFCGHTPTSASRGRWCPRQGFLEAESVTEILVKLIFEDVASGKTWKGGRETVRSRKPARGCVR